ncbi:MAG: peptidoglycan/LPS O-acetylase OafA/YrhL [Sediminicola sp.]
MNQSTSIYLDFIRFLAALVVFFSHASVEKFTGDNKFLTLFRAFDHDAVVIFFVLSGYVITYVAHEKEKTIDIFFIKRFAKLYSVVIPALLISLMLEMALVFSVLDFQLSHTDNYPALTYLVNLSFLNQIWFLNSSPFLNTPFWSLGYEFWYYVLFGALFYLKKHRAIVFLILTLIVGPSVLMLFPVWLMGYCVYAISIRKRIPQLVGWLLFIGSIAAYFIYNIYGSKQAILVFSYAIFQSYIGNDYINYLGWSKYVLSDLAVGLLVTANFIGFISISDKFKYVLERLEKPIRFFASFTFILYLAHLPLLHFLAAIFKDLPIETSAPLVFLGTLLAIWLLAYVSEKKKRPYEKAFTFMFTGIGPKVILRFDVVINRVKTYLIGNCTLKKIAITLSA